MWQDASWSTKLEVRNEEMPEELLGHLRHGLRTSFSQIFLVNALAILLSGYNAVTISEFAYRNKICCVLEKEQMQCFQTSFVLAARLASMKNTSGWTSNGSDST